MNIFVLYFNSNNNQSQVSLEVNGCLKKIMRGSKIMSQTAIGGMKY